MWVTLTLNPSFRMYTKVPRGQHGVEAKSMIYLVLVKKDMMRYVQNVRPATLCKVRLGGHGLRGERLLRRKRWEQEIKIQKKISGSLKTRKEKG